MRLACQGRRGRPPTDHRRVLDAIFWIARTGAPWRDLLPELGNWNSMHRQFRRWMASGLWDVLPQAFADSGSDADALQMLMARPGGRTRALDPRGVSLG